MFKQFNSLRPVTDLDFKAQYLPSAQVAHLDIAIGNPYGGPLMGEKAMPFAALGTALTTIGAAAGIGSGAAAFGAMAATAQIGAVVGAVATVATYAGVAMSVIGAVTGDKDLMKIGGIVGLAGGVGSLAVSGLDSAFSLGINEATNAANGLTSAAATAATPAASSASEAAKGGLSGSAGIAKDFIQPTGFSSLGNELTGATADTMTKNIGMLTPGEISPPVGMVSRITPEFSATGSQLANVGSAGSAIGATGNTGSAIGATGNTAGNLATNVVKDVGLNTAKTTLDTIKPAVEAGKDSGFSLDKLFNSPMLMPTMMGVSGAVDSLNQTKVAKMNQQTAANELSFKQQGINRVNDVGNSNFGWNVQPYSTGLPTAQQTLQPGQPQQQPAKTPEQINQEKLAAQAKSPFGAITR